MFKPLPSTLHTLCVRLLLILCGACSPAWATPCLYLGADVDARVMNRSGEISAPFPTALASNDCTRLRVAVGLVKVYVVNGDKVSATGIEVVRGPLVPAGGNETKVRADAAGVLRQIVLVLEGVNRIKSGSSRNADIDYITSSLPKDKLSEPTLDLVLEVGPVPDQSLSSFELLVDGKSVSRQIGPATSLRLPHTKLRAGSLVRWKLDYAGKKQDGQFTIEPPDRIRALVSTLDSPADKATDAIARAIEVAAILTQEGFGWDAREVLRKTLSVD